MWFDSLFKWSCSIDCQAHIFFFKTKNCSNDDIFIIAMIGLEKCCIPSACLQWLCHSGERTMARGPLVFFFRFYGPVSPFGSCQALSVYLTTRLPGRLSPLSKLTSIVHIFSPETDNCPSWISGRERMTVENISWSISTKECCRPRRELNPRPPGLQLEGAYNWAIKAGKFILCDSLEHEI